MNGFGKIISKNGWIFEGTFLEDKIFDNQQNGKLLNNECSYKVSYVYLEDLKMKVFKTNEGKIFCFNKEEGIIKNIL